MIEGLYEFAKNWSRNGAVWIYSDPHFGDPDCKLMDNNWPSDEEQIRLINSKVGKKDTLIILGDCGDLAMCAKLRGYKVLVMGNHDAGRTNYEHNIWSHKLDKDRFTHEEALNYMKKLHPNCRYFIDEGYGFHAPFEYWRVSADNCLFDEVYEGPLMIAKKLILSHEPLDIDWAMNLHGHVHDPRHKNDNNHMNFCSNVINYSPVNFNQLVKHGLTKNVQSLHRKTIDAATKKVIMRKKKNI